MCRENGLLLWRWMTVWPWVVNVHMRTSPPQLECQQACILHISHYYPLLE